MPHILAIISSALTSTLFTIIFIALDDFVLAGAVMCIVVIFSSMIAPLLYEEKPKLQTVFFGNYLIFGAYFELFSAVLFILIWLVQLICETVSYITVWLMIIYVLRAGGNIMTLTFRDKTKFDLSEPFFCSLATKHNTKQHIQTISQDTHNRLMRMAKTLESIIDQLERDMDNTLPSCKPLLMKQFKEMLKYSEEQSRNWNIDADYVKAAYDAIYVTAFNMLSSGHFHIYRGMLNPMNESNHLYGIALKCLNWYVKNGIATNEQREEQISLLRKNISEVG